MASPYDEIVALQTAQASQATARTALETADAGVRTAQAALTPYLAAAGGPIVAVIGADTVLAQQTTGGPVVAVVETATAEEL